MEILPKKVPFLQTPRLRVRLAGAEDVPQILRYYRENEAHFAPWSPPAPEGFLTEAYWRERCRLGIEELRLGVALRFFIFKNDISNSGENPLIGSANYTQIMRGPLQACFLGYGLAQAAQGQGYMQEALRATIDYVFDEMKLHRIMANYLPYNVRSGSLLERLGFVKEGVARDYLLIDGQWRDHVLTSLVNPNWKP